MNQLINVEAVCLPETERNQLKEIVGLWSQSAELMYRGCVRYVQLLDKYPQIKEILRIECGVPENWLRKYESVGRNLVDSRLMHLPGRPYQLLSRCPVSEQKQYLDAPVEVAIGGGDVRKIDLNNLTKEQIEQVFAFDHVRTLPEQIAWREKKKETVELGNKTVIGKDDSKEVYEVSRKGLQINRAVFLTKSELLSLLQEMI